MAINFPDNPNANDVFTDGGKSWIWDGTTWKIYSSTTSGIGLGDLSVNTSSVGTAALSYNNTTGVFTYTPPDLSAVQSDWNATTGLKQILNKPTIPPAYTLPTASTTVLGGVKVDGSTINIANGVISGANTYSLPTSSTTVLGGVKIDGTTITINNGVITASSSSTTTNLNLTDESGDTECFPVFCGAATNNQTPHTNASLKFNATSGQLTASSFKKIGGSSSEFLKADGSIDSTTYLSADPLVPPVVIGGTTPATAGQTQLTLRSNSQVGLSLLCGSIQNATITFGGVADGYSSGVGGFDDGKIMYDNSSNHMQFDTAGNERLRINNVGSIGIGGANYGTSGQFLKSTGNSSAPVWDDAPGVPIGTIVAYGGTSAPSGWQICNGATPQTTALQTLLGGAGQVVPDLRDRFIVGAGSTYNSKSTGGSTTDTVTISGSDTVNISASDNVSISGTTGTVQNGGGPPYPITTMYSQGNHTHSFSGTATVNITASDSVNISGSDTVNTVPPYYALIYIIKY